MYVPVLAGWIDRASAACRRHATPRQPVSHSFRDFDVSALLPPKKRHASKQNRTNRHSHDPHIWLMSSRPPPARNASRLRASFPALLRPHTCTPLVLHVLIFTHVPAEHISVRTSAGGRNSTKGVGRTCTLPPQKLSKIAVSSEGKRPHCHHSSTKASHARFSAIISRDLEIGGNTGGCSSSLRSAEAFLGITPQVAGGSARQHRRGRPPGLSRGACVAEKKRHASKQKMLPVEGVWRAAAGGSEF